MADDLSGVLGEMLRAIAEIQRRLRNHSRIGTVREVDPKKGLARVELSGQDGVPFLSPWTPWCEAAAGAARTHLPPSVGQQVRVRSQSGDMEDAEIDLSVPSDGNPRPSDKGDSYVLLDVGATRVEVGGGGQWFSIVCGSGSLVIDGQAGTLTAACGSSKIVLDKNGTIKVSAPTRMDLN